MSQRRNFLKIVILGDSGVGKTTLLQQYVHNKASANTKPTIGADFSKKEIQVDGQVVSLQIWDTAGQEKFQSLGFAFYRGADCCALTFDLTNPASFDALNKWKEGFIENAQPDDPKSFPFVLIGNKLDKENERSVPATKAEAWCKENNDMPYFETSAKEGFKVSEAFIEMVRRGIARESNNQIVMPDTIGGAGAGIKLSSAKSGKQGKTQVSGRCC